MAITVTVTGLTPTTVTCLFSDGSLVSVTQQFPFDYTSGTFGSLSTNVFVPFALSLKSQSLIFNSLPSIVGKTFIV